MPKSVSRASSPKHVARIRPSWSRRTSPPVYIGCIIRSGWYVVIILLLNDMFEALELQGEASDDQDRESHWSNNGMISGHHSLSMTTFVDMIVV